MLSSHNSYQRNVLCSLIKIGAACQMIWLVQVLAPTSSWAVSNATQNNLVTDRLAVEALAQASVDTNPQPTVKPNLQTISDAIAKPEATVPIESSITNVPNSNLPLITVGISVSIGQRTYERVSATTIRGQESPALKDSFNQWLLPLDVVLEALKAKNNQVSEQELILSTNFASARLNLKTLVNDPTLGLVISIQQVQDLFGIKAFFDRREGAIVFEVPEYQTNQGSNIAQKPTILDGLSQVDAPGFTVGMVEQRVNTAGTTATDSTVSNLRTQGTFLTVGSAFGGSWYAEINQQKLFTPGQWSLNSFQYLRQTPHRDFFAGAQPTFWQGQGNGDFWGITTIGRTGFTPIDSIDRQGGADPSARIQPSFVTGSLNGYAEPGTLVRLMRGGEAGILVAEQLVDTSGRYQFSNVPVGRDEGIGSNYQILLYPRGQLTATPRIETPRFILLPELLPAGASSQIFSLGGRRTRNVDDFFGQFNNLAGGFSQRWGVSQSLTLGLGSIYDNSRLQGVGELFFQPKATPLRFSATGFLSSTSTIKFGAAWDDYPNLYAQWNYDGNRHSYNVDMPIFKPVRAVFYGNSQQGANWGLQFSQGYSFGSTFARVILQPNQELSWDVYQNLDRLSLSHRKNDAGTINYVSYRISPQNSLVFDYTTFSTSRFGGSRGNDRVLTGYWRYQSSDYQIDGSPLWGAELGYSVGSRTTGPYAALSTAFIPGLSLQLKYQAVSSFSDASQFSLSLVSSMGTQGGFYAGNRRLDAMRTQGGLLIQPFLDRNTNGLKDEGEPTYMETTEFLEINQNIPPSYRMEKHSDRLLVRLTPGNYRVDIDPSGFPPDFQPADLAFAAKVTEGSYTHISLPLQPVHTVNGVITQNDGKPMGGARVEVINLESKKSKFTITNAAGVYYLDSLPHGKYEIRVNGQAIHNQPLILTEQSKSMQELNFQMPVLQFQYGYAN